MQSPFMQRPLSFHPSRILASPCPLPSCNQQACPLSSAVLWPLLCSVLHFLRAAVGLAEELLASGEQTLDLREVPNFARLVQGLSQGQLAVFCRVLAMLVMEPEVRARACGP